MWTQPILDVMSPHLSMCTHVTSVRRPLLYLMLCPQHTEVERGCYGIDTFCECFQQCTYRRVTLCDEERDPAADLLGGTCNSTEQERNTSSTYTACARRCYRRFAIRVSCSHQDVYRDCAAYVMSCHVMSCDVMSHAVMSYGV